MSRLWVRLTLAFLVTALIATGVVALLSLRSTGDEFRQYVVHRNIATQPVLVESLTDYYTTAGSWEGVASILDEADAGAQSGLMGRGRRMMLSLQLTLADAGGKVVYDASQDLIGEQLSGAVLDQGVPLELADGSRIGTLLSVQPAGITLDAQDQAFLTRVRRSLWVAGVLAVAVALALGLVLSRRLTAPLRRLTEAAAAIAAGRLSHRTDVQGADEIGRLGTAFNHMAASLQESEALRRNMMADVAHELRTPLTVIQGNLQAMLDGVYPLDMAHIAGLHDETRLLTRLVEDLRDLALAEAGQLRLERMPLDVAALAGKAVANFAPAAEAAGITLGLAPGSQAVAVEGDADRLGQVLRNLLSNALRHTPAGGRIDVSVRAEGGRALVTVSDTGSGIAAQDLPHVFDRFYRGDKSRRGSGAGLGLAIARQLALAHGGDLSASSVPGRGAAFVVTLPVASRPAEAP